MKIGFDRTVSFARYHTRQFPSTKMLKHASRLSLSDMCPKSIAGVKQSKILPKIHENRNKTVKMRNYSHRTRYAEPVWWVRINTFRSIETSSGICTGIRPLNAPLKAALTVSG
jgi:hypothetical protein